jgi:hypothetical protein
MDATAYRDRFEYLRDLLLLLDTRIYYYYTHNKWLEPSGSLRDMLGGAVSSREFERNLAKGGYENLENQLDDNEAADLRLITDTIALRLRNSDRRTLPLERLCELFELDAVQRDCVLMAYAAEQTKYGKLFAYLQDDPSAKRPKFELAAALSGGYRFRDGTLFASLFDAENFNNGVLKLAPAIAAYIISGDIALPKGYELSGAVQSDVSIDSEHLATLERLTNASEHGTFIQIRGAAGRGKRQLLRRFAEKRGETCLFAEVSAIENFDIYIAATLARLCGAYLCLHAFETERETSSGDEPHDKKPPPLKDLTLLNALKPATFLLSTGAVHIKGAEISAVITLPSLNVRERLAFFRAFTNNALDAEAYEVLAQTYSFEPALILGAARRINAILRAGETLGLRALNGICSELVTHKLEKLATKLEPKHSWSDIILPKPQLDVLKHACSHIRKRHKVYVDWGFQKNLSYGTGLSVLLYGAPGTGKTMCAEIIASELGQDIYRVDISRIVSKYIGETEKNLAEIFNEAKKTGAALFFDECDALFGRRGEIKDAHDRNANIEVAYLLQRIEEHDGVTLLSTNIKQNIDPAFMRRITYAVRFPFPDAAARKAIYLKLLPEELPRDGGIDWGYLAERFPLSGGHIKNIVLSAAFAAANDNIPLTMRHLLTAALRELQKNDIAIVRGDYREYADLLFDEAL